MLFAGQIGKLHKLNCCYRTRRQTTLSPMIVAGRFEHNTAFTGGVNLARIVRLEKATVLSSLFPPLSLHPCAPLQSPDTYIMILRLARLHSNTISRAWRRSSGGRKKPRSCLEQRDTSSLQTFTMKHAIFEDEQRIAHYVTGDIDPFNDRHQPLRCQLQN